MVSVRSNVMVAIQKHLLYNGMLFVRHECMVLKDSCMQCS